jgi:Flp pilus assembly protein protease CpaA
VTPGDPILALSLVVASITDLRNGRIPNWLTLALIATGIGMHLLLGSVVDSLLGLAAAFGLHFALWVLKVEKAGDAKLMMGVGAFVGWAEVIEATLWMYFLLVPVGVLILAMRGRLGNFLAVLRYRVAKMRGADVGEAPEVTHTPVAPVIAAGVLVGRLTDWLHLVG